MSATDPWQLHTPVALFIFNRPAMTEKVFEVIRRARPAKLLVVADGPRPDHPEDAELCASARAIVDKVDWDCNVQKSFSESNLGCKRRVSSGLDWVFNQVEESIILEDDCLPDSSFFRFSDELLERYRSVAKVMMITGNNFQCGQRRTDDSYYFSRYAHVWGWASWRRAWQLHYDVAMQQWPKARDRRWLKDMFPDAPDAKAWTKRFQAVYDGAIDTWDYQWTFACWLAGGLTITPNVNLVSNIGFGVLATHTTNTQNRFAGMTANAMEFPLRHPPFVIRDSVADDFVQTHHFHLPTLATRVKRKLAGMLRGAFSNSLSI